MIRATSKPVNDPAVPHIIGTDAVARVLCSKDLFDWPSGIEPENVRIERLFPERKGGFVVEWSFDLQDRRRYRLFGRSLCQEPGTAGSTPTRPVAAQDGLRGVLVRVPQWDLRIQSPDCDPDMPCLPHCLDSIAMKTHLTGHLCDRKWNAAEASSVECRILGYRPGRRAAIAYRVAELDGNHRMVLGKAFSHRRGQRLVQIHKELNQLLSAVSNGRARAPHPIAYLDDLRLLLLTWDAEPQAADGLAPLTNRAYAGIDLLTWLHRVSIDDLPEFSRDDDCVVLTRWQSALTMLDPPAARLTRSLHDALVELSSSTESHRSCTIHRDFYERQYAVDGSTISVFDLDTLARGDPGVDVGNFLAHLLLTHLRNEYALQDFVSLAAGLVRRYVEAGYALDRRMLAFHWASALFRLGAVHAFRTTTRTYVPALWQLSSDLLAQVFGRSLEGRAGFAGQARVPNPQLVLEGSCS